MYYQAIMTEYDVLILIIWRIDRSETKRYQYERNR